MYVQYLSLQQTGHTALMLAAKAGHLNIVKKLITSGARLDITDKVNCLSSTGMHCTQLHARHVTVQSSLHYAIELMLLLSALKPKFRLYDCSIFLEWCDSSRHGLQQWAYRCIPGASGGTHNSTFFTTVGKCCMYHGVQDETHSKRIKKTIKAKHLGHYHGVW